MSHLTQSFNAKLKDSGERTNFSTGSVRDKKVGKGRFDLLPFDAIAEVAKHFEKGAEKYGDRNWEKGQPLSSYLDSALRHLCQFGAGLTDEPHIISAAWNVLCLIQTAKWIERGVLSTDLNDLPIRVEASLSRHNAASQQNTAVRTNEYEAIITELALHAREGDYTPLDTLHRLILQGQSRTEDVKPDPDERAEQAYELKARAVYGEYLDQPFVDEQTLGGEVEIEEAAPVEEEAATVTVDLPCYFYAAGHPDTLRLYDGEAVYEFSHVTGTRFLRKTLISVPDFQRACLENKIFVVTHRFTSPHLSEGLKYVEFCGSMGFFIRNDGTRDNNPHPFTTYANNDRYTEIKLSV